MLLAGDAAGFIDPITGDGLHFALMGAALAASTALDILAGRVDHSTALAQLTAQRRRAFAAKWRFNRAIRALVASPAGVGTAAIIARVLPSVFEGMLRYAGDCDADAAQRDARSTRDARSGHADD
jgi:flavin-dependent dehydrogenase